MQQYRLNYPLLIGLAIGTVLTAGAVYGIWDYQIHRRSVALVEEADKAEAESKYKDMTLLLGQYLSINPKDQVQQVRCAQAHATLAEQIDTSFDDRSRAVGVMEATLRMYPDEKDLRKRLAKFYGGVFMYKDALGHLNLIQEDKEAQVLRSKYLFQSQNYEEAKEFSYGLIGYDPKEDKFDPNKATAPDDADVYLNLALVFHTKDHRPELAEKMIEQGVKANPNSAQAWLARGQYFIAIDEAERGKADVAKALAMSPQDAEILIVAQDLAVKDKEFDKAREIINNGKKFHPMDWRFYQAGASERFAQKDYPGALKEIDDGLKAIPGAAGRNLLYAKARLQLESDDFKGIRETIEEMRLAGYSSEVMDWFTSKVLMSDRKWFAANALLKKLRPWAESKAMYASEFYYMLGVTSEQLGQYELALRAFELLLEREPKNEPALAGVLRNRVRIKGAKTVVEDSSLDRAIDIELAKPKDQQNWAAVGQAAQKFADEKSYTDLQRKLLAVQILLKRGEYATARNELRELLRANPTNIEVQQMIIQSVRFDPAPGQGPKAALAVLDKLQTEDQYFWRLVKAELLVATKDEGTGPQLSSLLAGIDGWTDQQKILLWAGMADRFLNLNMVDEARRCLTLVAEAQPGDLPSRMKLFAVAFELDDDDGMKAAQKEILKLVGSSTHSDWLYSEARRRLSLIRRGLEPASGLDEVRQLVARALVARPEWADLHLLNAEIELAARRPKLALEHLDRIEQSGGVLTPVATGMHIRLLANDGQLPRAVEMLKKLPEALRESLLGELYFDLLVFTDNVDEAVKAARAAAEAAPTNAQAQFRYGRLLARSADQSGLTDDKKKALFEQAIAAVDQAVKIQPEFPDAWYSLVVFHAMGKNIDGALAALRRAQLALSADTLQGVLAKSYESLGGWFDAEVVYRSLYESEPDDLNRVQALAAFYVGPGYKERRPDTFEKAAPLINQVLKAGADGKIPANDEHLLWARRTGAKLLADTGEYQQLLKAEKMLASNSQDGVLPLADRLEMAKILSSRPEPESLIKAAGLLEEIEKAQRLGEESMLMLANIYYQLGRWEACRTEMQLAAQRFQKSARVRRDFANMLLARGELRDALKYIGELRAIAPNDPATFELSARFAIKANQKDVIHRNLINLVSKFTDPKALSEDDVKLLKLYAGLLTELGDRDRAEAVWRLLAQKDPASKIELATFIGMYRDVDKCFDMLDSQFSIDEIQNVLQVAVAVVRQRRQEVGTKFDSRVDAWMNRGLQKNFGSIPLLMAKAEFREVQQKYDEAISIYRELLANADLTGRARAILLNNLSFLLAVANQTAASAGVDPLALVNEAAQILGPTVDILDTRAVVYISLKKFDEAIADATLSVSFEPSPAKYFHKTQAHLGANQNKAALEAWAKAEELGLSRDALNQLEYDQYQQVKSKIEQLRTGNTSVTRAEPATAK